MDLRASLPFTLPEGAFAAHPDGEVLLNFDEDVPLIWVSRAAPPPKLWAAARAAHRRTGWWPLLLVEPGPEPDPDLDDAEFGAVADGSADLRGWWEHADGYHPGTAGAETDPVEQLLADNWRTYTDPGNLHPAERTVDLPHGLAWPGLAPAGAFSERKADAAADHVAESLATRPDLRLGLVRAPSGAAALGALGWDGPLDYGLAAEDGAAILADWERRFGVRVVAVSEYGLTVSTATVPVDEDQAWSIAVEHHAYCPKNILGGAAKGFLDYARGLMDTRIWSFWWD